MAESTVRTGRRGLTARLVGLGLGALAIGLGWGLFRQPSSEVAVDPPGEAASPAEADPGQDPGSMDQDASDGTGAGEDPGEIDDAGDEGDDAVAARPTTTADGARGSTSSDPAGSGSGAGSSAGRAAPSSPLLGEETGLLLVMTREGRTGLEILDLDTGELTELDRTQGDPIGAMGSKLVLISRSTGLARLLDLADPEADSIRLDAVSGGNAEVVEVTDDRIWTLVDDGEGTKLAGLDATGAVVEELDFPVIGPFNYGRWSVLRPSTLVYDPAGGLYRRAGDGFERVAEGQVLAAGERLAVIRQCDREFECRLQWYELRTSGQVGFPAPPPSDGDGFYTLLGGDRWLFHFDWRRGQGQLIEVATARPARTMDPQSFSGYGAPISMSDDGRWLVDVVGGRTVIVDLDSGAEWDTGLRGTGRRVLFVARPS